MEFLFIWLIIEKVKDIKDDIKNLFGRIKYVNIDLYISLVIDLIYIYVY